MDAIQISIVELHADFERSESALYICANEVKGRKNPDSHEVDTLMI
jgi:hypothetical protein